MEAGARASAELVATEADMASALALSVDDDFPEVFATSRMVALMELAAARCMKPLLRPGQLSVGVNVNVSHLAATPMGVTVRAEATFTGMQGKLYCFELNAWDKGGLIGQGSHTRAIIASERLLTGDADAKAGASAGEPSNETKRRRLISFNPESPWLAPIPLRLNPDQVAAGSPYAYRTSLIVTTPA